VVVWPKLYERQRRIVRGELLVQVRGVLQREAGAVSVVARHFRTIDASSYAPLAEGASAAGAPRQQGLFDARSRDFR
jgi:hypothetical protein